MHERVREAVDTVMGSVAARWLGGGGQGDLVVLAYHDVPDGETFAAQLDALSDGWRPVTLDDAVAWAADGLPLPRRACLVTFDDGDRTVLDVAAPLLSERGIPGVAFVVTDHIGTSVPFWWVEVAELVAVGARAPSGFPDGSGALIRRLKTVPNRRRLRDLGPPSLAGSRTCQSGEHRA